MEKHNTVYLIMTMIMYDNQDLVNNENTTEQCVSINSTTVRSLLIEI